MQVMDFGSKSAVLEFACIGLWR